ncbi:hypothetical protein [Vreelandella titanicae]|uniref:hypothetical protein n=1 Tax=Vreelandella titanicae TaxID=664683 RepID=UPI001680D421|nr:hypothetical protein [Halomonas titanicae]QNU62275.1 hypothetical protein HZS52_21445 [Halomonas titanicae]
MREYSEEVNEQYRAYGEFLVRFEHIVFKMQQVVIFILDSQGLKNQQVTQILLAGHTAYPLQDILHSLVSETQNLDTQREKLINKIFKNIKSIIEIRNDLAHSVSLIGYSAPGTEYSSFRTTKFSRNKSGASPKNNHYTVEKLDQLILKCQSIEKDLSHLLALVTTGLDFNKLFTKNKN